MKKVFFLLNTLQEFNFGNYIEKHLSNVQITVGESLPVYRDEYDLIVPWNYRKKIKNLSVNRNIIVFHSSDLPEGKGWAPIYYSIVDNKEYYVISGVLINEEIDAGNIIVKACFRIKGNYTAEVIRKWDDEISIILIGKILLHFDGLNFQGVEQRERGTYFKKRIPEDNEVDINSQLSAVINHIRACERTHPAYFYFNQTKYIINIRPETEPNFPEDLEIFFY